MTRALGRMPLYFIENRGQLDSRVAYYVQGRDTTLYFTADGMTLVKTEQRHERSDSKYRLEKVSLRQAIPQTPNPVSRWVVKLDFVGANPNPKIEAADPTPAVISYFNGPKENWKAGLSTYGSIVYSDLWPGIDLVYSGTADRLKYTFLVKPGADPDQVRLAYRGARDVRLNDAGQLEVETPAGVLQDDRPYAYQEVEGRRVEISSAYSLNRESAGGPHRYGFALGSYDRSKPLVLDPAVFVYAGYIGGNGFNEGDIGNGIAVDSSGNAYVTGLTSSTEATFPVTVGPDLTQNGGYDAFVAKVNAAGTALVYCGYIGGSSTDAGNGIAVDSSGNAYVTGTTSSTEATFPVTVGPDLSYNGGGDAFVAKVNAAGTALVYCGYIGGSGPDQGNGIAVDSSGNAYVTGQTTSDQATFAVTVGPDLTYNGAGDAFVAKVKADGTALDYCGYIGGSGQDFGQGIAVDSSGNAYVTGYTQSTQATFPVTIGPDLTYNGGAVDAFVAKVKADGTALVYCGYIGGNSYDYGYGIAVDSSGNAYVTGKTTSTEATFPVTVGPDLTYNGGTEDAFVAKVNAAGTALVYCGYIGGFGPDQGNGIAVDSSGNAYVTGQTGSSEATFPVTVGPDLTYGDNVDAFVAKVNAAGTALVYCGYIGGNDVDQGNGIAVDSSGNAYVTGVTSSTEATFPVTVGPDLTYNGNHDVFVAKVGTVFGDFNGDGKPDIVWRNTTTGDDAIWFMNGTSVIGAAAFGTEPLSWSIVGVGDFNNDGYPDIVWRNTSTGDDAIWFMNGTTIIGAAAFGTEPLSWSIVGIADFNNDGHPDIVWRNTTTGDDAIWFMNGTTVIGAAAFGTEPLSWSIVGVGDFNGDGHPDIVWRNTSTGDDAIWFMNGTTIIGVSPFGTEPLSWSIAAVGDFNNDGHQDIVWRNTSTGDDAIWFMNGTTVISAGAFTPAPPSWTIVGP